MGKKTRDTSDEATRTRLLAAAGEVFAEQGFASATIRQIVDRAGANIAAVNYHYGGKSELYSAVFKEAMRSGLTEYPVDMDLPADPTPEQRLRAFVRSFFLRAFSEQGCGSYMGRLILREMVEPTPELSRRVQETMRPMAGYLANVVRDLVGRPLDDDEVFMATTSIVAQVVFHKHCREVVARLFPGHKYDRDQLEKLARHVGDFSIAGLKAFQTKPARARA